MTGVEASSLGIEQAQRLFQVPSLQNGISEEEAQNRKQQLGSNELEDDEGESLFSKFIEKFKDPMVLLLLGSAAVSLLVKQYDDAISITLAIFIVCTVGFVQEYRSDKALENLKQLVSHTCTVHRDGIKRHVNAIELVVGDVVEFKIGDRIPADVRLVKTYGEFSIDEAIFTGEGKPRSKHTNSIEHGEYDESDGEEHQQQQGGMKDLEEGDDDDPEVQQRKLEKLKKNIHVGECRNMGFMGTLVSTGKATGIVTATGKHTELGRISSLLKQIEEKNTPLQDTMDKLSKQISLLSLAVIGVLFIIGVLTGKPWLEMFTIGISLAVAAIPEGLPIVVTVTLAMGVMRMAKRKAIVRKLPSVESLGATTVICVDKTGTLTQNEMTVTKIFVPSNLDQYIRVTGVGYNASGEFVRLPLDKTLMAADMVGKNVNMESEMENHVRQLLICGNLCNDAQFTHGQLVGQPTEGALIAAARKAGINDLRVDDSVYQRIDEIPFTSETKWMAAQCKHVSTGETIFYVKGATERILDRCTDYMTSLQLKPSSLTYQIRARIDEAAGAFENDALRVMALAQGSDLNRLTFLGLVGIYDPPRDGVKDAVAKLQQSGVKIAMITGDSKKTAVAIAKELGIISPQMSATVSESQLALSTDEVDTDVRELEQKIDNACVFYRMAPVHKMKIVQAFQNRGHIVAMTGDGVNDAPALKLANIGVAMGKTGTDVSKEAAEMILVDDNFATIMEAIEEGKGIFNNIKNFLRYQLTTSVSCMIMIIYCTVASLPLPLNPMQILFINIIMDGAPAQSLGVEPADDEVVRQPPRDPSKPIVTMKMIMAVIRSALIMVVGSLYVFLREFQSDGVVTSRDTTMAFATFVMFQMFNGFNCRNENKSLFQLGVFTNTAFTFSIGGSILGLFALVHIPFLNMVFETEPIGLFDWVLVFGITSTVWIVEEIVKALARGQQQRAELQGNQSGKATAVRR